MTCTHQTLAEVVEVSHSVLRRTHLRRLVPSVHLRPSILLRMSVSRPWRSVVRGLVTERRGRTSVLRKGKSRSVLIKLRRPVVELSLRWIDVVGWRREGRRSERLLAEVLLVLGWCWGSLVAVANGRLVDRRRRIHRGFSIGAPSLLDLDSLVLGPVEARTPIRLHLDLDRRCSARLSRPAVLDEVKNPFPQGETNHGVLGPLLRRELGRNGVRLAAIRADGAGQDRPKLLGCSSLRQYKRAVRAEGMGRTFRIELVGKLDRS
jgi:hypothetical protein